MIAIATFFLQVSTAQYFVWYFSLLPLVLQHLPWPLPRSLIVAIAAWFATELHWLLWGFMLEFKGLPVYLGLWGASCAFLAANAYLMTQLIRVFRPVNSFLQASFQQQYARGLKRL